MMTFSFSRQVVLATLAVATLALNTPAMAQSAKQQYHQAKMAYQKADYDTAMQIWQQLANKGSRDAQYNLGLMYFEGKGVPKNIALAQQWWQQAASEGDLEAQYQLGVSYFNGNGEDGAQDIESAKMWLRRAAANNYAPAIEILQTIQ